MERALAGIAILLGACTASGGLGRTSPSEREDGDTRRRDGGAAFAFDAGSGPSGRDGGFDACAPMDAARNPADRSCYFAGFPLEAPLYRWDGVACSELLGEGCDCIGADCAVTFVDQTSCVGTYALCGAEIPDAGGDADYRIPIRPDAGPLRPTSACSAVALDLIDRVNDYRADNGLPAIPASRSLCTVAAEHTRDLAINRPHDRAGCNLHSWSDAGTWSACCYTSDHARAECMWDKPRELTSYRGNGYENAAQGTETPAEALSAWRGSAGHNAVILNLGTWAGTTWRSLGADIYDGYAVLWFGEETDPAR